MSKSEKLTENDPKISTKSISGTEMATNVSVLTNADPALSYQIPSWAARPYSGCHLDVMKNDQLIQKLMVDEKRAYYFGRNPKLCDFVVEHASCSRVHALLVYHRFLQRFALIDLDSCHGTFVGKVRIDPFQPVFLEFASTFHFGASTRQYVLRGRLVNPNDDDEFKDVVPQQRELENLTEYNTALNRRIPVISITIEECRRKKRPRGNVAFIEKESIINPEDVDPTVGRFRNLVTTAIISSKRKSDKSVGEERAEYDVDGRHRILRPGRVDDYDNSRFSRPMVSSLSIVMNAAPDLELYAKNLPQPSSQHIVPFARSVGLNEDDDSDTPHKKKYAKESWPGRKPSQGFLA